MYIAIYKHPKNLVDTDGTHTADKYKYARFLLVYHPKQDALTTLGSCGCVCCICDCHDCPVLNCLHVCTSTQRLWMGKQYIERFMLNFKTPTYDILGS